MKWDLISSEQIKVYILCVNSGCGAIRIPATPSPTPNNNSTSWVTVETFNEEHSTVVCSGYKVIVSTYANAECTGQASQVETYKSGVCSTANHWGFAKRYTCSSSLPAYPERSLVLAYYETCNNSTTNNTLEMYRWVPTYKCMALTRAFLNPSGSGSGSSASSGSGSTSGSGSSSGSASASGGSASGSETGQQGTRYLMSKELDEPVDHTNELQLFSEYIDNVAGFSNVIKQKHSNSITVDKEVEKDGVGSISITGESGTGLLSSGFNTGTSGSANTGSSQEVNAVLFALIQCDLAKFRYATFANGAVNSATAGGTLSTGEFTSGDPEGSQMTGDFTSGTGDSSGGSGASGNSGSQSSQNGCSITPNSGYAGTIQQSCVKSKSLLQVTCVPPFHS
ncbi:hypothetical protein PPL_05608 [Heterostelium album PN500]|uniref:Uncharacterized protein n=1 Tax=Heterostelium pallidum (strain ATCC 26659 / Pp 5 / PN500) TaxID=670386 RepID=D3BAN0_HETP5|nr:hypothetical protein PPL_05608 [Heterostelium album PN500]EFA81617.1 hypothetical protein PPL_05608 [Heterostelium album PN500]|eukprot:XP_020433734.1 hypothetical protein PPL_05608 [Heterostelium album PN500]